MKIELTILLSVLSCLGGLFFGFNNVMRNSKNDEKQTIKEMAKIEGKIDTILENIAEIRTETKSVKIDIRGLTSRIDTLENDVKYLKTDISDFRVQMKQYEKDCAKCKKVNNLKEE